MTLTQERNERITGPGNEEQEPERARKTSQETAGLAAAGGDHRQQLKLLKHHRAFQAQERADRMEINWNTVITREQSRRHILQSIHAKINSKTETRPAPQMDRADERYRQLQKLADHIRQRQAGISPGDWYRQPWRLALRMFQAKRPAWPREDIEEEVTRFRRGSVPPREQRFPLDIQVQHQLHRILAETLRAQGASHRHARQSVLRPAYACPRCRNITTQEDAGPGDGHLYEATCPRCRTALHDLCDVVELAVRKDQPDRPRGSVECHRPGPGQFRNSYQFRTGWMR